MSSHYLDHVSSFVYETTLEDIGEKAQQTACDIILDTIGAIAAGTALPENQALAKLADQESGPRCATIVGSTAKVDRKQAALVNSTCGVALEMDEGNRYAAGHPSIHTMPGILAEAEHLNVSGRSFLEAFILGYEVEARFSLATRLRPGVHSHGHWGAVGTAAGIAKLRGFTKQEVRDVISLAASMSPANTWTPCFEGATIRNLYPGRSGMQGILAADLLDCGYTPIEDGPSDVYGQILGTAFDTESILAGLGEPPFRVETNYFKLHAACRLTHSAVDATLDALKKRPLDPDEVERIDCAGIQFDVQNSPLGGLLASSPTNMLGAKFSIPYAVAAAVKFGDAKPQRFFEEHVKDPKLAALCKRTYVSFDETLANPFRFQEGVTARSRISLTNGEFLEGECRTVLGDYGNRGERNLILEKFRNLTNGALSNEAAEKAIGICAELAHISSIRELTSAVSG